MNKNSASRLPAGQDVFDTQTSNISELLRAEIEGSAELDMLTSQTYSTPEAAKEALKSYVLGIWKNTDKMKSFGFTAPYDQMRKTDQKHAQNAIGSIADTISTLFASLLQAQTEGGFKYVLDNKSIREVTSRIEKESKNIHSGEAIVWNTNTQADLAFKQLKLFLDEAPIRLRALIKEGGFKTSVSDRSYKDSKRYTQMKTLFAGSSWAMMIFGHHGVYRNFLENKAISEHNAGTHIPGVEFHPGFFEKLNTDHQGLVTIAPAIISATLVSLAVMKAVGYIRKLYIEDAEAARTGKTIDRKVSTNKQAIAMGAAIVTGIAVPLAYEMGGLLEHGVVGHYVAYEAYKTQKLVGKYLDMSNETSPAGQAKHSYDAATNTIILASNKMPEDELKAKTKGGAGPSYAAKLYPKNGVSVLSDPQFANATALEQDTVRGAEKKLMDIGPVLKDGRNFHELYPTLPKKAERFREVFEEDTVGLLKTSQDLFGSIYEKRSDAQVDDLLKARVAFQESVGEYLAGIEKSNSRWAQRSGVYQELFDTLVAESNRKYSRHDTFDVKIQVPPPDMNPLKADLSRPLVEFKGKTIGELYDVLNGLVGVEGGISSIDKTMVLASIALRVGILEIALLILLFVGVKRAREYYNLDINALGKQEEDLNVLTEKLVTAVQKTFSGEGWETLFGKGHTGISNEQADYIVRELLVAHDAELEKYLPSVQTEDQKFSLPKKTMRWGKRVIVPGLKTIFMGDTRLHDERHVAALGRAFEKMSNAAREEERGIAVSEEAILRMVRHLVPADIISTPASTDVDVLSASYRKAIGVISERLGKLHETTRSSEARKIGLKQKEYEEVILGLAANVPEFTRYLPRLDAVLMSDDFAEFHGDASALKGLMNSWIARISAAQAKNMDDAILSDLLSGLGSIDSARAVMDAKLNPTSPAPHKDNLIFLAKK